MFERARVVLTVSYAAALVATLAGIGTVVYVLIRNDLNEEIDDSLRLASSQLEGFIFSEVRPELDRDRGDDDHEEAEHDGDRLAVLSSDVFYLAFDASGAVLFNPRGVNVEGIDLAGAARDSSDEPIQHVSGDDADYRVAIRPLGDGTYLAVGRSLRLVQHQLDTLRMVFLYGGMIGLGASIAIGFWLAGRTLTPIRHALESQRRFVSDASHELRTPLAVAKANSALILDDPEGNIESHLDQAEAIATELDHLTVLVGDLTTLARADEGRANLLLEPLDLGELTAEVVRDMGALADLLGVELAIETHPARVSGDRARLRQLLLILVDNSLKYAYEGGHVRIRCTTEGNRAELTVSDDGDGIAPADQKRIFERFFRADAQRTRGKGGTGLGLAIGKWITEAHGGRISVESEPGKGTTFHVRLPLAAERG